MNRTVQFDRGFYGRYRTRLLAGMVLLLTATVACATRAGQTSATSTSPTNTPLPGLTRRPASNDSRIMQAVNSAFDQTQLTFEYDPSYAKLAYPGGDISINRGVCADVIVRAFRRAGLDLQKAVHEDMSRQFEKYPNRWGARKPDSNIDHRRVPNLMTYFERSGKSVAATARSADYVPGDIVAWELDNRLLHIGLVTDAVAPNTDRYLVVHNIGAGARLEDVMFSWKIIGHYRMWEQR